MPWAGFIKPLYIMENLGCQPTSKKTLLNSIERLELTVSRFNDLSRLSELLVEKLEMVENTGLDKPNTATEQKQRDIIDLFNDVNGKLDISLNKIGSNIEKAISMIG